MANCEATCACIKNQVPQSCDVSMSIKLEENLDTAQISADADSLPACSENQSKGYGQGAELQMRHGKEGAAMFSGKLNKQCSNKIKSKA